MKTPGPDHPITVRPAGRAVRILWRGREIGRTDAALVLKEASYPEVFYVPRAAVDPAALERATRTSFCPYKGEASYFTLVDGATRDEAAVWSYETPFPAMEAIAGHLAFYPDKASVEPV
ncbi:MAG TPA: DUF427 domain-containing protein [Beijerinckiaceae bacterium]